MKRSDTLWLFLLGLAVTGVISAFQSDPGYMDADYYFLGGRNLVRGLGFNEMVLWNYLDDPQGLPHPSHTYWMPLASLLAAAGMALFRQDSFVAARLPFILLGGFIPPLTAALAYSLSNRRPLALVSGLLAAASGYYAPYFGTTDNFGLGMLLGALFFLALGRPLPKLAFWLGLLAGLLNLARSDGLLWLPLALAAILFRQRQAGFTWRGVLSAFTMVLMGFLLAMGPWYARNLAVFGVPMAPGASRALWLTTYDQTFIYPASRLSFESWLASGWQAILAARWAAFKLNLLNALAAQGLLVLVPFIAMAAWSLRRDLRLRLALLAWVVTFLAMTVAFPFAGPRGSYFHAGTALQPFWWAMAPLGLDLLVQRLRQRGRFTPAAGTIFQSGLVFLAALLTVIIVFKSFGEAAKQPFFYNRSALAETLLVEQGARPGEAVMVLNPPAYYLVTDRPALAVPDADLPTLFSFAARYHAEYLILTSTGTPQLLKPVYDQPENWPGLDYLGAVDDFRIFRLASQP